jgi:hypothetical protein
MSSHDIVARLPIAPLSDNEMHFSRGKNAKRIFRHAVAGAFRYDGERVLKMFFGGARGKCKRGGEQIMYHLIFFYAIFSSVAVKTTL